MDLTEEGLKLLVKISLKTSLRYAIHLITTSSLVATKRKSHEVDVQDIRRVYNLFVDVKRSSDFLLEQQKSLIFHEIDEDNPAPANIVSLRQGPAKEEEDDDDDEYSDEEDNAMDVDS